MSRGRLQVFPPIHLLAPDFSAEGAFKEMTWKVSARSQSLDPGVRGNLYGALFDRMNRCNNIPVHESDAPSAVRTRVCHCDIWWEEDGTSLGVGVELRPVSDPSSRYYSFANLKGSYVLRLLGMFKDELSLGDYLGQLCMAEIAESVKEI